MIKKLISTTAFAALSSLAQASDGHVFKMDQVQWQPTGLKGAEMAVLWGKESEGTAVWAFRLQPGVAIPAHTHSKDYWGFAVQGKWAHIDAEGKTEVTGQDAYVRILGGDLHADRCLGPEVCINVIRFEGGRDIFFPATPTRP